jgi:hypothetical protein
LVLRFLFLFFFFTEVAKERNTQLAQVTSGHRSLDHPIITHAQQKSLFYQHTHHAIMMHAPSSPKQQHVPSALPTADTKDCFHRSPDSDRHTKKSTSSKDVKMFQIPLEEVMQTKAPFCTTVYSISTHFTAIVCCSKRRRHHPSCGFIGT